VTWLPIISATFAAPFQLRMHIDEEIAIGRVVLALATSSVFCMASSGETDLAYAEHQAYI
jgi:hypothetical protein